MIFNKTAIGYSHIKSGKPCQDYSAVYRDSERTIITACDGHGGDVYIRSDRGSKFASNALLNVLGGMTRRELRKLSAEPARNKLRLNILCEWNRLVEEDLMREPIRKKELAKLSDKDIRKLLVNNVKAYGSTMIGAMAFGNKIVTICIGDGGAFFIRKRGITPIYEEDDDEPVGNMTYSLCEEDAYDHIKVNVTDTSKVEGVMLTSDGVINPYMNYANFEKSFAIKVVKSLQDGKAGEVANFIEDMGAVHGNGDDVTLSIMMRDIFKPKKSGGIGKKIKRKKSTAKEPDAEEMSDAVIIDFSGDGCKVSKPKSVRELIKELDARAAMYEPNRDDDAILDEVEQIVQSSNDDSCILDAFNECNHMQDYETDMFTIYLGDMDNDSDSSSEEE